MSKSKTVKVRLSKSTGHSRSKLKAILENAFRGVFPNDTVDISDGYQDNIHVMVVSRRFDLLKERAKHELMWGVIDSTDLTEKETQLISLVYPVSPAEIK